MKIPHQKDFLAFSVIGTVSLMPLLVLPAMVGVLVDNAAMSDSSAGWSASTNFLASAAVGLLLAVQIHRVNLRKLATMVLAFAIVADIASGLTAGDNLWFFIARAFAGFMLGATYVASVTAFARFDGFERGFGIFVTLQFIVSGLGLYVVPVYADQMGADGLFFLFAVLDSVALMLARFLPSEIAASNDEDSGESEFAILLKASAVFAILGFALFEAANNAQFAYIERFGVSLHISDHQIGLALLVASLVGIPGAFSIVVVGDRFGSIKPLVFGMSIAIVGLVILVNTESTLWFWIGGACMGYSWAFCLPFIQSLLAKIDRKGSAIAAGTSFSTFGSAFGPGLAAIVVVGGAYTSVFYLSLVLFAVTIALFVLSDRTRLRTQ